MEALKFSGSKGWQFWLFWSLFVVGVVLLAIGLIGNFVVMVQRFGYIALFAVIVDHWSFWLVLSGVIVLTCVFVAFKISKKN